MSQWLFRPLAIWAFALDGNLVKSCQILLIRNIYITSESLPHNGNKSILSKSNCVRMLHMVKFASILMLPNLTNVT